MLFDWNLLSDDLQLALANQGTRNLVPGVVLLRRQG